MKKSHFKKVRQRKVEGCRKFPATAHRFQQLAGTTVFSFWPVVICALLYALGDETTKIIKKI